jgi:hypothetical protein
MKRLAAIALCGSLLLGASTMARADQPGPDWMPMEQGEGPAVRLLASYQDRGRRWSLGRYRYKERSEDGVLCGSKDGLARL